MFLLKLILLFLFLTSVSYALSVESLKRKLHEAQVEDAQDTSGEHVSLTEELPSFLQDFEQLSSGDINVKGKAQISSISYIDKKNLVGCLIFRFQIPPNTGKGKTVKLPRAGTYEANFVIKSDISGQKLMAQININGKAKAEFVHFQKFSSKVKVEEFTLSIPPNKNKNKLAGISVPVDKIKIIPNTKTDFVTDIEVDKIKIIPESADTYNGLVLIEKSGNSGNSDIFIAQISLFKLSTQ